mmetsp:Transcript_8922/g.13399  ORF Transcript_8922/g.13399 Transcript_8922/m.13399 type:complete len:571 (-) Transcript_8922:55-1767(-)
MSEVARIRSLEACILSSKKHAKSTTEIIEKLMDDDCEKAVKLAAMHSIRRVFVNFLENNYFLKSTVESSGDSAVAEKLDKFRAWLMQQYNTVKGKMLDLCCSEKLKIQAAAIRTIIEFVRYENTSSDLSQLFGMKTLHALITKLVMGPDIDVDILLLLREEVMSKPDCEYHSLLCLRRILSEEKASTRDQVSDGEERTQVIQNALDLLRVVEVPVDGIDASDCLTRVSNVAEDSDNSDDDEEEDDESEDEGEKVSASVIAARMRRKKRSASGGAAVPRPRKRCRLSRAQQIMDVECHRKEFSRTWLSLLSLPLTAVQQRTALKHLPQHVIPYLQQPVLLADYLSTTVKAGGVVAVLALESLFHIIVHYNLDYPDYFSALYELCSVDVMSARYRGKFMRLLHASLKSSNIPAYVAGAFIKKLTHLCLHIPGPSALFCLAQVMWLLRHHPKCMVLIHREKQSSDGVIPFDCTIPLEKCDALSFSLHEAKILQNHYIREVAELATALENNVLTTSTSTEAPPLDVEQFIDYNYKDMIEEGLKGSKKWSAMSHIVPESGTFVNRGLVGKCFGSS